MTNGAVIVPENASVNLNRITKASTASASLRVRNSLNAPNAAAITRVAGFSPFVSSSASRERSGSVARTEASMPMPTIAAIAT